MRTYLKLSLALTLLTQTFGTHPTFAANPACENEMANIGANAKPRLTDQQAWEQSIQTVEAIQKVIKGKRTSIQALLTAILAKEFIWINGDPGGAKTLLSRIVFQSVLNTISAQEKKIFLLQFHKLMSEGKITGFVKIKGLLDTGKYDIETKSSLVGDKYLFLIADEVEKANPAVLNSLLSVLNERKAFLGARMVNAVLASGVFTSNKTVAEFIQSFGDDRAAGEALQDRMAIKFHQPNQAASASELADMYLALETSGGTPKGLELPLLQFNALVEKVKIPPSLLKSISKTIFEFDTLVTAQADESRANIRMGQSKSEYFPANQFSNRSNRRLLQIMKASFLAQQLIEGIPFDKVQMEMGLKDLSHMAMAATYGSPGAIRPKQIPLDTLEVKSKVPVKKPDGTTEEQEVVEKGAAIVNQHHFSVVLPATWDPYSKKLFVRPPAPKPPHVFIIDVEKQTAVNVDKTSRYQLLASSLPEIIKAIKTAEEANKVDFARPQFEIDEALDNLLALETWSKRTRDELTQIRDDLQAFVQVINTQSTTFDETHQGMDFSARKKQIDQDASRGNKIARALHNREIQKPGSLTPERRLKLVYKMNQLAYRQLFNSFPELEHSIRAHLTAVLAQTHIFSFGPPGGAKTSLSRSILEAELRMVRHREKEFFVRKLLSEMGTNIEKKQFLSIALKKLKEKSPYRYRLFLLQFHKLMPEGVIVGFPKLQKQMDQGVEEFDFSSSLACDDFVFAILDEVDKANPATTTALLSILNEREVFAGNTIVKAALRTAVITSNKMPSELKDSYGDDAPTADALMDRAQNKVFTPNKFSSSEVLEEFLTMLEQGIRPGLKSPMAIVELQPLVDRVKQNLLTEDTYLVTVMGELFKKFQGRRVKATDESRDAHQIDAVQFPDYYSAASLPSDRTFRALTNQLISAYVIDQMISGKPLSQFRDRLYLKDMGLFFQSLGFWSPLQIKSNYSSDGILEFQLETQLFEAIKSSGGNNSRIKFHMDRMLDEAKDYTDILNDTVRTFLIEFRETIAQYPHLFPTLFATDKDRENWVAGDELTGRTAEDPKKPSAAPAPTKPKKKDGK